MPVQIYYPSESDLMMLARQALDKRLLDAPAIHAIAAAPAELPRAPGQQERRMRSLRACHLPSLYERPRHEPPKDTGAYVPEASARLENDMNLTDGARRCARKILEETYRHDRAGRKLQVTVSYLARALRRSGRTIQRYLRMLEREGYLRIQVLSGWRSRMCVGLVIQPLTPLFACHHRKQWPENRRKPAATKESQNKANKYIESYNPRFRTRSDPRSRLYARDVWAEKCMQGVFRTLMRTIRPQLDAKPLRFGGALTAAFRAT